MESFMLMGLSLGLIVLGIAIGKLFIFQMFDSKLSYHKKTSIFNLFNTKLPLIIFALMIDLAMNLQAKPPGEEEAQKACRSDVLAYCKTEAIFGPKKKVQICLRKNESKLSLDCQNVLQRADAFKAELKANCGSDISNYCEEFEGDQNAMRNCIKKNYSKLSQKCQDYLEKNK